jgi:replicative DNA helicase Mcm
MTADPVAKWDEFLRSRYWDELLELADSYPDERSLVVKFPDLDRYDPEFAEELLENPEQIMEAAAAALLELDLPMDVYMDKAHVRIAELPRHYKTRELRSDHIGKLLAIEGLVRTATEVRPKIISAAFQCQRCGYTFFKEQTGTSSRTRTLSARTRPAIGVGHSSWFSINPSSSMPKRSGYRNLPRTCEAESSPRLWTWSWRTT